MGTLGTSWFPSSDQVTFEEFCDIKNEKCDIEIYEESVKPKRVIKNMPVLRDLPKLRDLPEIRTI